ncbi:MAG: uroporphyrinogen-III synthase [Vicingaceae bacterium]
MQQPLKNKTVLVTRSKEQAEEFIHQLKSLGAKTISLPLINTKAINQTELIQNIQTHHFDWIIFTSPNAVNYFFETVNPLNVTSKIAVVGSKTKAFVESKKLKVDFIPTKFIAKQLAEELPLSGNETIFIPRSSLAKDDAIAILENRNCSVKTLSIYENYQVSYTKEEVENIIYQNVDFITFTSGSTVLSFLKLGIPVKNEKVICIGPETEKVATQNNIKVTATANPHTIEGMINSIKKSLTN